MRWRSWISVAAWTVLAAWFACSAEWLFLLTRPGAPRDSPAAVAAALPQLSFPLLAAALALLGALALGAALLPGRRAPTVCLALATAAPAVILGTSGFLLLDNFTYTLFGVGVLKAPGRLHLAYAALHLALCGAAARALWRRLRPGRAGAGRLLLRGAAALAALSFGATGAAFLARGDGPGLVRPAGVGAPALLPDIILISADGLEAEYTSPYGSARDTTPTLRALAAESLVAENAFANAGITTASMTSVLTGRLPLATRVHYPPQTLRGEDALRHLPGLLRQLGYRSIDLSVRHFADAYDLNMRYGFDVANDRSERGRPLRRLAAAIAPRARYVFEQIEDRVADRLAKTYLGRDADEAFAEATTRRTAFKNDRRRLRRLLDFIDTSPRPIFARVHFLATHGGPLRGSREAGRGDPAEPPPRPGVVARYERSIKTFDGYVARIVQHLRRRGRFDNAILVVSSDHGRTPPKSHRRLPLLMRFPRGEHAGRIVENAQNLDVLPTLVDALGLPPQPWAEGRSLIGARPDPLQPLLASMHDERITRHGKGGHLALDDDLIGPPFYGLRFLAARVRQRVWELDVREQTLRVGDVEGHTAPDPALEAAGFTNERMGRLLVERLAAYGYDVSGLRPPFALLAPPDDRSAPRPRDP